MRRTRADLSTLGRLAVRHLALRRGRALLLLFGYAVGAAVMMVLLSVGEAMLVQSRDVALVGGGDVTVLPEGIDQEGLRTGSMSGLFFGIDRARFLTRQMIGGPRVMDAVAAVSPIIENELVYLVRDGRLIALKAGGELPGAARGVGSGIPVIEGRWEDSDSDRRFARPGVEELYHELDRFHRPVADSTWGEWHYFNVAPSAGEWWYITYLIGGDLGSAQGGGQLLVTRHRAGLPPARYQATVPAALVRFDTATADLSLGANSVTQRDGRYRLVGAAAGPTGRVRFDLTVTPVPNAYFPAVELRAGTLVSGYVVPAVRASADGTICEGGFDRCRTIEAAAGYHDHNWGVWGQTTWNWGQGRGTRITLVYGGVVAGAGGSATTVAPYFLAAVDSAGVRQVLRFADLEYRGRRSVPGFPGIDAPASFRFRAARERDTLAVEVEILDVQGSVGSVVGDKVLLQMRGRFRAAGTLLGIPAADSGLGFFETFVPTRSASSR